MDKIVDKSKHISSYMIYFILLLFLTILLHASFTVAHMEGGIDVKTGNYTIDIGYNTETIKTMQPTVFLIAISKNNSNNNNNNNKDQSEEVELYSTSLWIRIDNPENKTITTMTLSPEATGTYLFTATFPEKGNYAMKMKFTLESESIANILSINTSSINTSSMIKSADIVVETTAQLTVISDKMDSDKYLKVKLLISFSIGIVVSLILCLYYNNKKNKR